ncbi:hypothetical protein [Metabacillus litoralis]|uniref:hypothetical protein n=1 Tax=Metabacillus litoralis TaxID=152268 RepID=UPI001CFE4F37|nr:hypothetical protein [Metabacillus litoralis]
MRGNSKHKYRWMSISTGLLFICIGIVQMIVSDIFKLSGSLFILAGAIYLIGAVFKLKKKY